jgi:Cof subfamily protein (haloacid dehalogenase superfamily)
MIASDLDGTLLGADGHLSPRTLAAIGDAHHAGIVFAAATGRSHLTATPRLRPAMPAMRWAVCSNGASLFDLHGDEVASRHLIAADVIAALNALWAARPEFALGWETSDGFGADAAFQARHPAADGLLDAPTADAPPADGVVKVLVSHAELADRELVRYLAAHLPQGVEVATSGAPFVEITGHGVNKAFGLARLAESLSIDAADVIVFGDNHNDLPMFRWAGHAVAMGNAVADIAEAADEIADDHADDGVARVIERLLHG